MRKKMVLDGAICETCGCVIDPGIHVEKDPVTGHDIAWVCEKRLTVKMWPPPQVQGRRNGIRIPQHQNKEETDLSEMRGSFSKPLQPMERRVR